MQSIKTREWGWEQSNSRGQDASQGSREFARQWHKNYNFFIFKKKTLSFQMNFMALGCKIDGQLPEFLDSMSIWNKSNRPYSIESWIESNHELNQIESRVKSNHKSNQIKSQIKSSQESNH